MSDYSYEEAEDEYLQRPRFSDSPEYKELRDNIVEQLFEINGQIGTLQQFNSTLNSFLDNGNIKAKIVDKIDKKSVENIKKVRTLIEKVNDLVVKVDNIEETSLDKTQIISREKLNRDVKNSLQQFQNTQLEYTKVMKLINEKAQAKLDETQAAFRQEVENDTQSLDAQQYNNVENTFSQMVIEMDPINNEEFVYQQNLIRERELEISNIEQGIVDLNELFHDLGNVVQQQGSMVDNIEANIFTAASHTKNASQELQKALRYQRNSSKWCVYLLIVLLIFLILMILITLI
ncbi:SNAP receptor PEP12 KNAG_0B03100 [Huiozyma naganishii CBS 8797]|uniref:t-SNARE coiled-coil homology domain-containing protein n=1 Tax=Huiozyma naganishii (strain ATCC MYA-139 / BCRC 22969 / CBS 8797 / KCTC 17520 / NBRC 10181 / NCYC 3082 / Yp74L-3) TaxID=1071383 RepID=J7RV28_HUIN7|nr:hypothetical protein KNAG_0B03100 [Kazachstania naganishii CBS 8797]CCK68752.1 hypothetical protein KNAG_0B03100 [Kazachstania naganishii CBS 8797]